MPQGPGEERHSRAESALLITDRVKRARREASNAFDQFNVAVEIVKDWLQPGRKFKLRTSTVLHLHRTALAGISPYAGNFRPGATKIGKSKHTPPGAHLVPELIEEMCDYVNKNWRRSALHLCAYVMWRLNWIHPFTDGNGRTSRAVAYVVLCCRLGYVLPGRLTIPEQIATNKTPYYAALEAADRAFDRGKITLTAMEKLLGGMLAKQLYGVHQQATRRLKGKRPKRVFH